MIELEADLMSDFDSLAMCAGGDDPQPGGRIWTQFQLGTKDMIRYGEALIRRAITIHGQAPKRTLVLGGGDGIVVRELLEEPGVEAVTVVDVQEEVTRSWSRGALGREINGNALNDNRVQVFNATAAEWLASHREQQFDLVVLDLDSEQFGTNKEFCAALTNALAEGGVISAQWVLSAGVRGESGLRQMLDRFGFKTEVEELALRSLGRDQQRAVIVATR